MDDNILGTQSSCGLRRIDDALESLLTELTEAPGHSGGFIKGIPTGYPTLDKATGGLKKGCVTIIAGYAGVGKTTLVLNIVHNVIFNKDNPIPTLYISLGSSDVHIAKRMLTIHMKSDIGDLSEGAEGREAIIFSAEQSMSELASAPLYIASNPRLEYDKVRKIIIEAMEDHPIGLVVVDYINIMQPPVIYQGVREQEISAISRELKQVVRELEIPIIAVAALKRAPKDTHSRPKLSDLKESNALEYDADEIILFSDYLCNGLCEDPDDWKRGILSLAKNRYGPTDQIDVTYDRLTGDIQERECETFEFPPFSVMNDGFDDNSDFM